MPSYPVAKAEKVRATRYVAAERGRAFDDIIGEHARTHGVRADLVQGRDAGGIGLQPVRAVAERRARADAADAGDRSGSTA